MFKIGQKVVCIEMPDPHPLYLKIEVLPLINKIYTVRETGDLCGRSWIRLVEIVNPKLHYSEGFTEVAWPAEFFRLVDSKSDHKEHFVSSEHSKRLSESLSLLDHDGKGIEPEYLEEEKELVTDAEF